MPSKTSLVVTRLIIGLGLVLFCAVSPNVYADREIEGEIDRLVTQMLKPDSPGCVVAVIDNGRIVFKRGYGIANIETGEPITTATAFNIASVTKQFTAACIALLIERGKLSPEDDIRKYLPEMPEYEIPIKIKHLIYHTSGIRDFGILSFLKGIPLEDPYPEQETLDLLARQKKLNFHPGDMQRYSNSGYFLLGIIVKRVTGMSVGEFAEKEIFAPLGMKHTAYHYDPARAGNLAVGHVSDGDGKYRVYRLALDTQDLGFGGIYTTVEDMCRWDRNFYRNRIGGKNFNTLMQTRGVSNNGDTLSYAFGLYIRDYMGLKTVSHQGGNPGYNAFILRFPERKFTVICLANHPLYTTRLCSGIADLYLGIQKKEEKKEEKAEPAASVAVNVDPAVYAGYAGKYRMDSGDIFLVSTKENKLYIQPPDTGPLELYPESATEYFLKVAHVQVTFEREENGKATGLVWHQNGHHIQSKKTDSVALRSDQLAEYEGEYYSDELNATYGVYVKQDQLYFQAPAVPDVFQHNFRNENGEDILKHVDADKFKRSYGTIDFSRDNAGKITGFAFNQGGDLKDLMFTKR